MNFHGGRDMRIKISFAVLGLVATCTAFGITSEKAAAQNTDSAISDLLFRSIEEQQKSLENLFKRIEVLEQDDGSRSAPEELVSPEAIVKLQVQIDAMKTILDSICGAPASPETCNRVTKPIALPEEELKGEVVDPDVAAGPGIADSMGPEEEADQLRMLADYVIDLDADKTPVLVSLSVAKAASANLAKADECQDLGTLLVAQVTDRQDNQFYVQDTDGKVRLCRFVAGKWHVLAARSNTLAHLLERAPK